MLILSNPVLEPVDSSTRTKTRTTGVLLTGRTLKGALTTDPTITEEPIMVEILTAGPTMDQITDTTTEAIPICQVYMLN